VEGSTDKAKVDGAKSKLGQENRKLDGVEAETTAGDSPHGPEIACVGIAVGVSHDGLLGLEEVQHGDPREDSDDNQNTSGVEDAACMQCTSTPASNASKQAVRDMLFVRSWQRPWWKPFGMKRIPAVTKALMNENTWHCFIYSQCSLYLAPFKATRWTCWSHRRREANLDGPLSAVVDHLTSKNV